MTPTTGITLPLKLWFMDELEFLLLYI